MNKVHFDVDTVFELLPAAVSPYPKAALFELYDDGFRDPFEILVACIISIRTRDEATIRIARRLLAIARTPRELLALSSSDLVAGLEGVSFAAAKASNIVAIARLCVESYGDRLPCDYAVLTALPGVGPKCANLVLGIACGVARIGVDIHVHRVTNRWGYVQAASPEATLAALERKLPRSYWVAINRLLVPFGKHVCTGSRPHCTSCPIEPMCAQVGVADHR